jgi:hypothetical protein
MQQQMLMDQQQQMLMDQQQHGGSTGMQMTPGIGQSMNTSMPMTNQMPHNYGASGNFQLPQGNESLERWSDYGPDNESQVTDLDLSRVDRAHDVDRPRPFTPSAVISNVLRKSVVAQLQGVESPERRPPPRAVPDSPGPVTQLHIPSPQALGHRGKSSEGDLGKAFAAYSREYLRPSKPPPLAPPPVLYAPASPVQHRAAQSQQWPQARLVC